jgi:hypothetical protein
LTCGQTDKHLICIKATEKVKRCPMIDVWMYNKNNAKQNFISIFDNLPIINKDFTVLNFTDSNHTYLGFKMRWENYNTANYEVYFNEMKPYYEYNVSEASGAIFDLYYSKNSQKSDKMNFNPYFCCEQSEYFHTTVNVTLLDFIDYYNFSFKNITVDPQFKTLDPQMAFYLRTTYLPIMNAQCIEQYFINNETNNKYGYLNFLTKMSFEFIPTLTNLLFTWVITQFLCYLYWNLNYEIGIVYDTVNNSMKDFDMKNEKISLITFKIGYYITLSLKVGLYIILNEYANNTRQLLWEIYDNNCLYRYDTYTTPDASLIHLHIRSLIKSLEFDSLYNKIFAGKILLVLELIAEFSSMTIFLIRIILHRHDASKAQ